MRAMLTLAAIGYMTNLFGPPTSGADFCLGLLVMTAFTEDIVSIRKKLK